MSYPTIKKIALDIYNNNIVCFNAKQGDTGSRYVEITCTEYGKKIVLDSDSTKAYIVYLKADGTYGIDDVTVLSDGCLSVELTQNMLAASGKCKFDVILADAAGTIEINEENGKIIVTDTTIISTMCFYVNVLSSTVDHTLLESSNEFNAFINAISKNIAIETELRKNEDARIANENQRIDDEDTRKLNESGRISTFNTNEQKRKTTFEKNEEDRQDSFESGETKRQSSFNTNEGTRQTTFENTMNVWQKEVDDVIDNCEKVTGAAEQAESTRQTTFENCLKIIDDAIYNCETVTNEAEQAENTRQTTFENTMDLWYKEIENKVEELTKNEDARIASENQRVASEEVRILAETQRQNTFDEQIAEMDEIVERINGSISGVINDAIVSSGTTYSSEKINQLLQVINQLSNPNLLINGDFQVWQRGESFTLGTSRQYTSDRWFAYVSDSGSGTLTKVENGLQIKSNNTQAVLGYYCEKLYVGKTLTLSCKVDGVVYGYTVKSVGTTWTYYNLNGDTLKFVLRDSSGENAHRGCELLLLFNDTNTHIVEWVKLEQGSIVTPFVPRNYVEELDMCKRYCEHKIVYVDKLYKYDDTKYLFGYTFSDKRATPTVTHLYYEYYMSSGNSDTSITSYSPTHTSTERHNFQGRLNGALQNDSMTILVETLIDAEIY